MKQQLFMLMPILIVLSCNAKKETKPVNIIEPSPVAMEVKQTPTLKALAFASKKDLVCEMPITAGVSDTVTYKGKLYGFCAKECKDEFLKNPNDYLTTKK